MILILVIAVISNSGELLTIPSHANAGYFRFYDNAKPYVSYRAPYDILIPLEDPSCRVPMLNMMSSDSLQTIWLPTSTGGVIGPGMLVYNSTYERMYIISGRYTPNIAVCDAQSGVLLSVISTDWRVRAFACSETSNKLYCANDNRNTIEVIDCQTNQVIETARLRDRATALAWSGACNEIYCTQSENYRVEVIDCTSDSLITTIHTSGYPRILYYNPISDKVYCANWGNLDIIDANSHIILATIPLDPSYYFFTFNTLNNKIYCIDEFNDYVAIIDGVGDTLITTCQLGSHPLCSAYNSVENRVYIGNFFGESVYIFDGNTNELIDILFFDAYVSAMAYDSTDNRLFVVTLAQYDEDWFADMLVLDGTSNAIIDTLETGVDPFNSIIWEREYNQVWVANRGLSNLPGYTIDGYAADSLQHRFTTAVGFTPFAAVLNPATEKYYCVGRSDDYIVIFDTDNPDSCVLKETGECVRDILLNPLENKIYCANYTSKNVSIIDGATDSIIADVPIGSDARILEFNHTDNKVYVGSMVELQGGYVTVIDGHTNAVLETIPVPMYPSSMLWNSIDNKLYVACYQGCEITILDAHEDTVLTTIPTHGYAWSLVHNTVDNKVYCSVHNDVIVIDGATDEVVAIIPVGGPTFTFTYNPVDNKIYCARQYKLTVLDGATDAIIKHISASGFKSSLVYNPITNTIFCAYAYDNNQDAIMVVDGVTDCVLTAFLIDSQVWAFGVFGGLSSPREALLLDSLNNIVYFNHYYSSKISVLDGATGIEEGASIIHTTPFLSIFPNPSTQDIKIAYSLPHANHFQLNIYDVTGRLVKQIDKPINNAPIGQIIWDRNDNFCKKVSSGIYFLKFKAGHYTETRKLILLR